MLTEWKFLELRKKRTDVHFGVHTGMRVLNINAIHCLPSPCEVCSLCGSVLQTLNVVLRLSCFISFLYGYVDNTPSLNSILTNKIQNEYLHHKDYDFPSQLKWQSLTSK